MGCIPANWAFVPFVKEMKRYGNKIEVTEADSLSLASMLETKALSCAFLPSVDLYNNANLEMVLPVGFEFQHGMDSILWSKRRLCKIIGLYRAKAYRAFTASYRYRIGKVTL